MNRLHVVLILSGVLVVPAVVVLARGCSRPASQASAIKRPAKPQSRQGLYVPPKEAPAPASSEEIGQASQSVRLKSTLRNYRTALATGNERMSAALKRVLLRDSKEALQLARLDLDRAGNDRERELARKTLESLEKRP